MNLAIRLISLGTATLRILCLQLLKSIWEAPLADFRTECILRWGSVKCQMETDMQAINGTDLLPPRDNFRLLAWSFLYHLMNSFFLSSLFHLSTKLAACLIYTLSLLFLLCSPYLSLSICSFNITFLITHFLILIIDKYIFLISHPASFTHSVF